MFYNLSENKFYFNIYFFSSFCLFFLTHCTRKKIASFGIFPFYGNRVQEKCRDHIEFKAINTTKHFSFSQSPTIQRNGKGVCTASVTIGYNGLNYILSYIFYQYFVKSYLLKTVYILNFFQIPTISLPAI